MIALAETLNEKLNVLKPPYGVLATTSTVSSDGVIV